MSRLNATLLLLLAAALWGFTFVVQKWATQGEALAPLTFTGVRFLLGALVITPLAWREARTAQPLSSPQWRGFALCGLMLFMASWLQQRGIVHTSVSNAGFFTGIYVVLIPFLGWGLFRLRPHALVWPATLITLTGIWLLNGGSLTQFGVGDWWVIASSVFWAMQITLVGVLVIRTGRPLTLAWLQFLIAGMVGTLGALIVMPQDLLQLDTAWRELLWSGAVAVGVAFTLQVIAQRHLQPAVAAIIMGSEMLFAALAGRLFLDEQLAVMQWLGGALIFVAIVIVEAVPQMRADKSVQAVNDA